MNFHFRFALVVGAVVLTSGCATAPQAPRMTTAYNPTEVGWSRVPGTAVVEGSTALPVGGVTHTCAGSDAQLFAADAYAAEMMRIVFGNDVRGFAPLGAARYPADIDADFRRTVRRVACDADGRFRFDRVPAGRWYVFASIVYRDNANQGPAQGGSVMQRVDVAEGARAQVLLTP